MENGSLREEIRRTIGETLPSVPIQGLGDDDDLFMSGLDSINAVTLIFALQQQLGIEFGLDEINVDNFRTVNSIVTLVSRKRGQ